MFDQMNTVLAQLHSVDPTAVGLQEYGKHSGFYERQISTWTKQYEAAKVDEIPAMDRLGEWLAAHVPPEGKVAIVHGDFRLDNLIMDPSSERVPPAPRAPRPPRPARAPPRAPPERPPRPQVLAVLDWELSTLGDPLATAAPAPAPERSARLRSSASPAERGANQVN